MANPLNPKRYTISPHTFTQPYTVVYNPFYQSVQDQLVEQELDRLDAVDILVDEMLTYPDAEAIINKLKAQGE